MKIKLMFIIFICWSSQVLAIETKAEYAFLIDNTTNTVLFEKNADVSMAPSSMSKLMTVYVIFDRIKKGTLSLEDKFKVSEKAWRKGGSKMFLRLDDMVSVKDLMLGVIIQSGNDACITLAEGIAGSEEAFAQLMNNKAKEIGLTNSHFSNSTGWPDQNHKMSARDLAILAKRLINDFPEYYHYFSEKEFVYNGIRQENRNMLLSRFTGTDGLKTGHADEAGYGITASAIVGGKRLILVVNGLSGTVQRANEAERLLQFGFLNFTNIKIANKGQILEKARLWRGKDKFISLMSEEDIVLTLPKEHISEVKAELVYNSPIIAPVMKGQKLAELVLSAPNMEKKVYVISAQEDVRKVPYISRLFQNISYYLFGLDN